MSTSNVLLKLSEDTVSRTNVTEENQEKPKSISACRLFGVDLVSPSNVISSSTRLSVEPVTILSAINENPEESDELSALSKASKEVKQVSSKEISSTRSCIKVKCIS